MKDWRAMPLEDRQKAMAEGGGQFSRKEKMDACLRQTMNLLDGNSKALALAWKLAWGCYLVNTPEEIVAYCTELALKKEG